MMIAFPYRHTMILGSLTMLVLVNHWVTAARAETPTENVEPSSSGAATNNAPATAGEPSALLPPSTEPTIVTSERLRVDYLRNVGTFEGNVLVIDPRITVRADKMIVTFGGGDPVVDDTDPATTNLTTRTLDRIEASGAVVITQTDKKAESEHAIYTASDGKVVLTGAPRLESPDGTVTGSKITFWRDDKRMDVESTTRTQLILYPEEFKKQAEEEEEEPEETSSSAETETAETVETAETGEDNAATATEKEDARE